MISNMLKEALRSQTNVGMSGRVDMQAHDAQANSSLCHLPQRTMHWLHGTVGIVRFLFVYACSIVLLMFVPLSLKQGVLRHAGEGSTMPSKAMARREIFAAQEEPLGKVTKYARKKRKEDNSNRKKIYQESNYYQAFFSLLPSHRLRHGHACGLMFLLELKLANLRWSLHNE